VKNRRLASKVLKMNNRFEEMRELLENGKYFKLVCGAGNEDAREVYRLATIYTLAGCNGFDVSATVSVVDSCVSGIKDAYKIASEFNITIKNRPFITVSVGMPGDHHVRKAEILDHCVQCNLCIPACPTDAIPQNLMIIREKCIGCGDCESACPPKVAAIGYEHNERALKKLLPECLEAGAENIELHAAVPSDTAIMEEWLVVNEAQPNNFISMCLDRAHLSNTQLADRIRKAVEISGERTIIQADGIPMSGGNNNFNTTLQAIAIADIINKDVILADKKKYKNLHMLLSGGTNDFTGKLAQMCLVPFSGVAIGTHARKIVKEFVEIDDLKHNHGRMSEAIYVARQLIMDNLETLEK